MQKYYILWPFLGNDHLLSSIDTVLFVVFSFSSSFPPKPPTAWKTRLMSVVFECVDLADTLSLWCCNPVTNSVLYLLVGIWFHASVALNYNHVFITVFFFSVGL